MHVLDILQWYEACLLAFSCVKHSQSFIPFQLPRVG